VTLRVQFFGVRGSSAAAGREFMAVGGNTSCVAVLRADEQVPALVLDAGTGLQPLSAALDHQPFVGTVLLTHLHWDHLQGLPFFRAGDQPDARVHLVMPAQGNPVEVLRRAMSPPHFPIGPDELLGDWSFDGIEPGRSTREGFDVRAAEVCHKGGRTYGYRVEADGRSFAYLPDHCIGGEGEGGDAAHALCEGVDALIHDAQFVASERALARDYGHSTVDEAVELARSCGAGRLVLFHHGPARTDSQVEAIVASLADAPVPITLAVEGLTLEV
jgi:ribonuclease BN (tRNA processing enzyme)